MFLVCSVVNVTPAEIALRSALDPWCRKLNYRPSNFRRVKVMRTTISLIITASAITILNIGLLALNLSVRAKADVAGLDWRELSRDRDFKKAVQNIVGSCTVDGEGISC
jgi:hypothetical protein